MSWQVEWRALAARIEGLGVAGDALNSSLAVRNNDMFGVTQNVLVPAGHAVITALADLARGYQQQLPKAALTAINAFLYKYGNHLAPNQVQADHGALQVLIALRALRAELDYFLSDAQVEGRRRVERAFLHLQRSLAVDDALRHRWQAAKDEPTCEKLGAVHLLAHGIWAFKAHGPGARTDLVLGAPIDQGDSRLYDVEALVLTEWKIAETQNLTSKVDEAHTQLRLYKGGILAGFELTSRRYVVVVSDEELHLPDHHDDGGIECRHICINRGDDTPSTSARKSSSKK
jgi:hypothetical protein